MMEMAEIRHISVVRLAKDGIQIPSAVPPLLEDTLKLRGEQEIQVRSVALFAFLVIMFSDNDQSGVASRVTHWLNKYALFDELSEDEQELVGALAARRKAKINISRFDDEVEALWMLAWLDGQIRLLNHKEYVGDSLGALFPNISKDSAPDVYYCTGKLRSGTEAIQELDYLYCLHWWLVESKAQSSNGKSLWPIDVNAVRWRRHALEWALSDFEWDDISLDT